MVNCCRGRIIQRGVLNFRNQGRADYGRVGKTAEDGDVSRLRNSEANGNGKMRDGACPAKQSGQIVWQRIFCAGDSGSRDEIEESGRDLGNLF